MKYIEKVKSRESSIWAELWWIDKNSEHKHGRSIGRHYDIVEKCSGKQDVALPKLVVYKIYALKL